MKLQFTTGTVGAALIEAVALEHFTMEDGLATIDLGEMDRLAASEAVGAIGAQLREGAANNSSVGDAQALRHLADELSRVWSSATHDYRAAQEAAVETAEPTDTDTGSHSLPTGDGSTSQLSQEKSDTNNNEENTNGKSSQVGSKRSRS